MMKVFSSSSLLITLCEKRLAGCRLRHAGYGALLLFFMLPSASFAAPFSAAIDAVSQPSIVILIDDLGNNLAKGRAAVELPGPVTYAVLPHSPYGSALAREALASGKEVILHAPMQNTHDRPLGPGALVQGLSKDEFVDVLRRDLDSVPGELGLNNHMGSLLTQLRPQMEWVMEIIRERQLFFVDSRTTAETVALQVAREQGVPYLRRDIFLDNELTTEFVDQQFQKTLALARANGSAIAIGHPHSVTVAYLKQALPKLDEMGIRLVSASGLLQVRNTEHKLAAYQQRQQQRAIVTDQVLTQ